MLAALEGRADGLIATRRHEATLAWSTAGLQRVERMPKLDAFLGPAPRAKPKKPQSWRDQKAAWFSHAKAHGVKAAPNP